MFFSFFALLIISISCNTWAVLVAGSKGYSNYRHQADICQAYQQISKAGIPDERIIVWMYDDIAHNWENPHKGSIINYKDGPNVYPGVPHDYTKKEHNIKNFLKFLKGEDMTGIGSGKSLQSKEDDRIFIYFADHGGPGVICFPGMAELHVKDLMDTLKYMWENKMYKELIFYMEACESGSMFDGMGVEEMNVYAVTASNPTQSSYACDHSWKYFTYLNDCWSRDFLNDTRSSMNQGIFTTRTFEEQFQWVKIQSTQSPECRYGNLDLSNYTLNYFQGEPESKFSRTNFPNSIISQEKVQPYDVKLSLMQKRLGIENDDTQREKLQKELDDYLQYRDNVDKVWENFADHFGIEKSHVSEDTCHSSVKFPVECMKEAIERTKLYLGSFTDYSAKYYKYLKRACLVSTYDDIEDYWMKI